MTSRSNASFPHVVCGDVVVSRRLIHEGWRDPYYDQFFDQFVVERNHLMNDAVDLRIELNAVIFADGTLIGPDDGGWLANLFSAYVEAKQDWYRGIIDALDAEQSVAEAFAAVDRFQADRADSEEGWNPTWARRRSGSLAGSTGR